MQPGRADPRGGTFGGMCMLVRPDAEVGWPAAKGKPEFSSTNLYFCLCTVILNLTCKKCGNRLFFCETFGTWIFATLVTFAKLAQNRHKVDDDTRRTPYVCHFCVSVATAPQGYTSSCWLAGVCAGRPVGRPASNNSQMSSAWSVHLAWGSRSNS